MRIAIIILGLCLGIGVAMQSFFLASAASFTRNVAMSNASSSGIIMALLLVIGTAFGHGVPKASIVCFGLAAFLGIQTGSTSPFHDLRVWGFVALGLAVMSYFADRELRARRPAQPTEPDVPMPETPSPQPMQTTATSTKNSAPKSPLFDHYQRAPADAVVPDDGPSKPVWPIAEPRSQPQVPPVQASATPPMAQASIIDHIERLATLRASGAIDEAEYQSLKAVVLNRGANQP